MPFAQKLAAIAPLICGAVCCWYLARSAPPSRAGVMWAVALVVTCVVWSRVQKVYEGPTVVAVTDSAGVTIADLVIVPSLGIAAAVFVRARQRRSP